MADDPGVSESWKQLILDYIRVGQEEKAREVAAQAGEYGFTFENVPEIPAVVNPGGQNTSYNFV